MRAPKEKIGKLNFIKIENLYISKDIKKVKRQLTDGGKILENHTFDKGLIYRIYN